MIVENKDPFFLILPKTHFLYSKYIYTYIKMEIDFREVGERYIQHGVTSYSYTLW